MCMFLLYRTGLIRGVMVDIGTLDMEEWCRNLDECVEPIVQAWLFMMFTMIAHHSKGGGEGRATGSVVAAPLLPHRRNNKRRMASSLLAPLSTSALPTS